MDMLHAGWRIYANRKPWDSYVGLWLVNHSPPSFKPALITNFTCEEQPEGFSLPPEPTMILGDRELQEFVNHLWDLGIRPTQATTQTDKQHLLDMRMIAFHKLGIEIKP